jgi:hypothetical protein
MKAARLGEQYDRILRHRRWLGAFHAALALISTFSYWLRPTILHVPPYTRGFGYALLVYTAVAWLPLLISWTLSRKLVVGSAPALWLFVTVLTAVASLANVFLAGLAPVEPISPVLIAVGETLALVFAAVVCGVFAPHDSASETR